MNNVYNEPLSDKVYYTLPNNTRANIKADAVSNPMKALHFLETDTKTVGHFDDLGNYHVDVSFDFDGGIIQISENFALFEITEDGTPRLGIKKWNGATWEDTGNRLA